MIKEHLSSIRNQRKRCRREVSICESGIWTREHCFRKLEAQNWQRITRIPRVLTKRLQRSLLKMMNPMQSQALESLIVQQMMIASWRFLEMEHFNWRVSLSLRRSVQLQKFTTCQQEISAQDYCKDIRPSRSYEPFRDQTEDVFSSSLHRKVRVGRTTSRRAEQNMEFSTWRVEINENNSDTKMLFFPWFFDSWSTTSCV